MKNYSLSDIKKAIDGLRLKKNDTIYVSGNLVNFGYSTKINVLKLPEIFFKLLLKKIGPKGTIVVPTHSFFLIKKKKIFDIKYTQSESGAFSNYLLKKKNSVRQIHPYSSSTAYGWKAKYICSKNSSHVYGPHSPFERMIELNTKFISLAMPINKNCSQVHHAEFNMSVPYRYIKEFKQKIKQKEKISTKKFYLFVLYKQFLKKKRNKNKIIIRNFLKKSKIIKCKLGDDYIYKYSLKDFYSHTIDLMQKNIYCWIGSKPKKLSFTK